MRKTVQQFSVSFVAEGTSALRSKGNQEQASALNRPKAQWYGH